MRFAELKLDPIRMAAAAGTLLLAGTLAASAQLTGTNKSATVVHRVCTDECLRSVLTASGQRRAGALSGE